MHGLDLAPRPTAPAGLVRRRRAPSPSRPRGRRPPHDRGTPPPRRRRAVTSDGSRAAAGTIARQQLPAHGQRLVDHRPRRRRAARRRSTPTAPAPRRSRASAAKSPIVSWKRRGAPSSSTPSTSPSSTRSPPGSRATSSTTARQSPGDLVQVAGEQPHVAAVGGGPGPGRRRASTPPRPGRWRRARRRRRSPATASIGCTARPGAMADRGQRRLATGERGGGRRAEVARQHVRPPHRRRPARRPPWRSASTITPSRAPWRSSPPNTPPQQPLLGLGRPPEHLDEQRPPRGDDASAGHPRQLVDHPIDLADLERRLGRRLRSHRPHRRPTDPDPALGRRAGQEPDRRSHLRGRGSAQHIGDQARPSRPASRWPQAGRTRRRARRTARGRF